MCPVCKSRRRKAEALACPSGDGRDSMASESSLSKEKVLDADVPVMIAKSRTPQSRVAEWLELKALDPNMSNIEAAKRMGLATSTLNSIISRAVKAGWLKFDDPMSRMEHEIIPQVMDNLSYHLKKKDKTVTIETAKGTIFKQFQADKGVSDGQTTILALKLELPEGTAVAVGSGKIVGTPKAIDADFRIIDNGQ